jgi:hypothetical protein
MISLEIILAILFLITGFIILIVLINKNRSRNPNPESTTEFTLDVSLTNTTFDLYVSNFGSIIETVVDWGDGNSEIISIDNTFATISHTYSATGNYTIKFTKVNGIDIVSNYNMIQPLPISIDNKITDADFTKLKEIYVISIYDSLLTSLDITGLVKLVGLDLNKNTLTVESVNTILSTFNSFDKTFIPPADFGVIDLSNQNPSAPPSVGPPNGITAKSNLISRGWTVNTD